MAKIILAVLLSLAVGTLAAPGYRGSVNCNVFPFPFVTRAEWEANEPTAISALATPVPMVIIHHTYIPSVCLTKEACIAAMKSIQFVHQRTNGWADIGYNFAVGGDGAVYEGRGWEAVGAHARGFNTESIGIVLIGDWVSELPSEKQLQAAKDLISVGVELGYIQPEYLLKGHRQVGATECPGSTLFAEISTWKNFVSS